MWNDPVVKEVRKAGEQLAKDANYDLHTFFENMRESEKKRKDKTVSKTKYKSLSRLGDVLREK
jgi:hypothetical protein